ncbi:MAG: hypothetical protein R6V72_02155 [Cyclobacterium sp.]|uniref:hypothetical protein n=1 Tax=unclassified Cyclobacterium TaxID=2615055 RepID=UPI0013D082AE|nr:hypothetical protein [Cyclobacterium sp. SYSU L10401]
MNTLKIALFFFTHLTPSGLVTHGHRIFKAYKVVAITGHLSSNEQTFADGWEYIGIAIGLEEKHLPVIFSNTNRFTNSNPYFLKY